MAFLFDASEDQEAARAAHLSAASALVFDISWRSTEMPYVLRRCENGQTIKIYEPNASEIRAACDKVREKWSRADVLKRLGQPGGEVFYEVPTVNVSQQDLANLGL